MYFSMNVDLIMRSSIPKLSDYKNFIC